MEKLVNADARTRFEGHEVDLSGLLLHIQVKLCRFASPFHQCYPIYGKFTHVLSIEDLLLVGSFRHECQGLQSVTSPVDGLPNVWNVHLQ